MLKLYDTYKKTKVPFKSIKAGKVGMYNCGPTVYDYLTIGNLRAYVVDDLLRRTLEYLGYEVKQVMNITDVGHLTMTEAQKKAAELAGEELEVTDTEEGLDRMEKAAEREGISAWDVAKKYTESIFGKSWNNPKKKELGGDFGKLNILKPHVLSRATDHIEEQIDLIKKLEAKGYTYKTKKAVYFDIQKFPKYEKLIGQKFEKMQKGKRADTSDPDRKHPADFRLWQLDQPEHEMQWDSPWGKGFPGWHIECSAMSTKYLGQPFDIHTGGEDHIKVHHPNEMAQSECGFDKPFANYWLHVMFLTVGGKRMGKSLGNAYALADVEKKGFDPMDLRYFYLQAHYRTKQDFTWENLKSARKARKNVINGIKQLTREIAETKKVSSNQKVEDILTKNKPFLNWKRRFIVALENDLNLPKALSVFENLIDSDERANIKLTTILDFDRVLGLKLKDIELSPTGVVEEKKKSKGGGYVLKRREIIDKGSEDIWSSVEGRRKAKRKKDWDKADEIRTRLWDENRVRLEDSKPKGTEGATMWTAEPEG